VSDETSAAIRDEEIHRNQMGPRQFEFPPNCRLSIGGA